MTQSVMEAVLKQLIHDPLDAESADAAWVYLVSAACEGRDALDHQLGGTKTTKRSTRLSAAMPVAEPPGAYLRSISVEGFRGIGPRSTLTLKPGPASRSSSGETARESRASPKAWSR